MMKESEKSHIKASKNKFLTFFLGEEEYGIDISQVKEIIAIMKTTGNKNVLDTPILEFIHYF